MRTEAPALIPIFRSDLQARLLLRVHTDEEPHTASELARFLDAPEPTVHREASRLADAGLLLRARVGRSYYSRVRRARNAGDHRGEDKPQSADDVRADLPDCRRIVDIAANTLPHLTPFA